MHALTRKLVIWTIIVTAVLAIPAVAMQFTREVNWTLFDFMVAGILLSGMAFAYELLAWKWPNHRVAVGASLAVVLAWIWVELAVGLFTHWGS